jgi:hypothetical protein
MFPTTLTTKLIALGVLLILLGVGSVLVHHKIYQSGYDAAVAEQAKAAKKDHDEQQAQATTAEHTHDAELAALRDYRDTHPDGPVRLCLDTTVPARVDHRGPSAVSGGPAAPSVQPVPAGDRSGGARRVGTNIGGLLEALADRADQVSADRRALRTIVLPLAQP